MKGAKIEFYGTNITVSKIWASSQHFLKFVLFFFIRECKSMIKMKLIMLTFALKQEADNSNKEKAPKRNYNNPP